MITPDEINKKTLKLWDHGTVLRAALQDESLFPWQICFRKPGAKQQLEEFPAIRHWIQTLKAHSKEQKKAGYNILYKTITHRQLGKQQLPYRIEFSSQDNFLHSIGKTSEFRLLLKIANQSTEQFPLLHDWIADHPRLFMQHITNWEALLSVCHYFVANPQHDYYLRELEIADVDSKFIEKNKKILTRLLDLLLQDDAIDKTITGIRQHGFERRYGLKFEQPLIRLRLLDQTLYPAASISDISLPLSQLANWHIPCKQVFITENKVNGLSFPERPESIVIFGLGYGIDSLRDLPWLQHCNIYYWGDIDTHGFSILSRLRASYPETIALMMDASTLQKHETLCVTEPKQSRCKNTLKHLNKPEQTIYQQLQNSHQRLEQERLPMAYVIKSIRNHSV